MASGVFGSVKPANINPSTDAEILYYYRPTRGETSDDFNGFKSFDATEVEEILVPSNMDDSSEKTIDGLFSLKLPLDKFNKKGFYSVYIRPKECSAEIVDVSVLAAYPDVKGVVFNINKGDLQGLSDLTGYRIEFEDGSTRLIKSCNRCEPVVVNASDGYPKSTRYNLVDTSSDYVFCTVSPSSAPSFKTNAAPYIGEAGVEVKVINTKFSPKLIELELTTHDFDTISYTLEGSQATDRDKGVVTTYNDDNDIYTQHQLYTLKDKLGNPKYNVKEKMDTVDNTQTYDNIIGE